MSYILEALRKSEQERLREAAPTLHTVHMETFAEARRFTMGSPPLLLAGVAVVFVFALSWSHLWQPAQSAARPLPAAAVPGVAPPQSIPQGMALQSALDVQAEEAFDASLEKLAAPAEETAAAPREKPAAPPSPASERRAAPPVRQASSHAAPASYPQTAPVQQSPMGAGQAVLAFTDLPLAVQRTLPNLSISGYVGAPDDAGKRMVVIGDRIVQEGDEISPGLVAERIAGDGVVFGYKGYRFWLGQR